MANGKTGSLIWTSGTFDVRVNWSETYDVSSNMSSISISSIEVKSTGTYGYDYYPNGTIKINGTTVKTISSSIPTGYVYVISRNVWYPIKDSTKSSANNISCSLTNIPHNLDGSKSIDIELNLSFYPTANIYNWKVSGAQSISLTTIPRASTITSAQNITLGNTCSITWEPKATTFRYKLSFSLGNWSYTTDAIAPNTTSSYSYTKYVVPLIVANQLPTSTTGTMTVVLLTYSDTGCTNLVGTSSKTFTITIPSNIIPSISSVSASIDNSANSVVAKWGLAVVGYTKVKIVAEASGSYGSSVSSFTISGGYNITQTGSSLSYTGSTISSSGSKTFTVVANDSRGRKSAGVTSNSITFYAYSKPNISSFVVSRSSSNKSKVLVKAAWTYSSVNGKNSAKATLYYKKSKESSWTTYGIVENNKETILAQEFDETLSYNFKVVVTDSLSQSGQEESFLSTIKVLMDFRAGGNGLGIGKIAESDNLEIAFNSIFIGDIFIRNSSGNDISLTEYIRQVVSET